MPLKIDYAFGKEAVARGLLDQERLEECVELLVALEQVESGKRLWDVIAKKDYMNAAQIEETLATVKGGAPPTPACAVEEPPGDSDIFLPEAEADVANPSTLSWDIALDAEVVPVTDLRSQRQLDPSKVPGQSPETAGRRFKPGKLRVNCVKGPLLGRSFVLANEKTVIGRDSTADIVITDLSASRRHAEIVFEGGRVVVRDLNSRNGISVNGRKVSQAVLCPGERVRVGRCEFVLE